MDCVFVGFDKSMEFLIGKCKFVLRSIWKSLAANIADYGQLKGRQPSEIQKLIL